MDGLCLKTGINGMVLAISMSGALECRTNATQVSAMGRSSVDNKSTSAAAVQPRKTAFSSFSFRYPLRSLWPGGGAGNDKRYNGMAIDDAVLVESNNGEARKVHEENMNVGEMNETSKGRNGIWVLKILLVKSLWREGKEERESVDEEGETGEENNGNGVVNEEEEICEFCRVDDDDEDEKKRD